MKTPFHILRRKARARRMWREWIRPVLPVVIVLLAMRSAVADWNDVPTGSMKPTILEGDRIFVNRMAYDLKVPFTRWSLWAFDGPQRGDIVVFFSPKGGTRMVKRVIGLPGDTVRLLENRLYINGEPLAYESRDLAIAPDLDPEEKMLGTLYVEDLAGVRHPILRQTRESLAPQSFPTVELGEDEYFVMGDNRDNSSDSRVFGIVPRRLIAGQATRVLLSVHPEAWTFRWNRTWQPLK